MAACCSCSVRLGACLCCSAGLLGWLRARSSDCKSHVPGDSSKKSREEGMAGRPTVVCVFSTDGRRPESVDVTNRNTTVALPVVTVPENIRFLVSLFVTRRAGFSLHCFVR